MALSDQQAKYINQNSKKDKKDKKDKKGKKNGAAVLAKPGAESKSTFTKVTPSKLATSRTSTATSKGKITTKTTGAQTVTKKQPKVYSKSAKDSARDKATRQVKRQRETAAYLGLDASNLNPLHALQRDALTGTTTQDKRTYAQMSGAVKDREKTEEEKKRDAEASKRQKIREHNNRTHTLSKADRQLSDRDQYLIRDAKTSYDTAKYLGDEEGMERAHERAETVRRRKGYSGGPSGDETTEPQLTDREKLMLNSRGETALKSARLQLEEAKKLADKEKVASAEDAIRRIWDNNEYWDRDYTKSDTTGHGATLAAGAGGISEEFKKNVDAGATAITAGVLGAIPSLVETSAKATDNLIRENNREDLQNWSNNLQHYKFLLNWLRAGNEVKGETESSLEQKIRIAQNAKELLESGRSVDPTLPGQSMLRKGAQATEEFMKGKTGVSKLLASAGLSMAQMAPALAAGALIPGAGPAVATGLMGAQAAGQKSFELNEMADIDGLNYGPAESQIRGIVSGAIEALTEKIPVESLLKVVKAGGGSSLIRNVAKQAGIEATEESASYTLNFLADKAAQDPEAKFSLKDLAESAAVGAISGGALAGGATALNRLSNSSVPVQQQEPSRAMQLLSRAADSAKSKASDTANQAKESVINTLLRNTNRNTTTRENNQTAEQPQDIPAAAQNRPAETFIQERSQAPGAEEVQTQAYSRPVGRVEEQPAQTTEESWTEVPDNVIRFPTGDLPEGMGAMSSGGAGEFANWQGRSESFHPINESAAATTAEQRGRAATEIPTRNLEGRLTSKVISTFANANILPNEMVTAIESNLANGAYSRLAYKDAAALEGAESTINEMGFQAAKEHWLAEASSGRVNKSNAVLGIALINRAANSPALHMDAMDLLARYADFAKDASQALQSMNMINKLSPQGQLYTLVKTVEFMEERANKNRATNPADIEINPELASLFMEAETQKERDSIKQDIIRDVAAQLPSSWRDRFDAWRYLAMLGNPRTHIRNFLGNAGFAPFRGMKNVLGAAAEKAGGTESRTKSVLNPLSKEDRARLSIAMGEFGEVEELIKSGGKYIDDYSKINMERDVWKSENKLLNTLGKPISKLSDFNSAALDKEDMIFAKPAYASALAGYLKANGVTAEEYAKMKEVQRDIPVKVEVEREKILPVGTRVNAKDRGNYGTITAYNGDGTYSVHFVSPNKTEATVNLPANLLVEKGDRRNALTAKQQLKNGDIPGFVEQAQEYAIKEAQKSTYRDTNDFSAAISSISQMRNSDNKIVRQVLSPLAEGIMPFKKTPANILVRTLEYSPFGLAKGIGDAVVSNRADSWLNAKDPGKGLRKKIYDMKQGVASEAKTPAEAIDEIAAGLSGTGIVGLGMLLGYMGIAVGGATDDDKQDGFNSLQGHQNYALEIGDRSYTIDWLAPEALPFFVGVELQKAMESLRGGSLKMDDITSALSHIAEPMLEMSMLQGLNDLFDTMGSENALSAAAWTAATSYLTQFLPTLGGQIERTMEDTRQTTFVDKESGVPVGLQRLLGNVGNKIPGWEYNQTDYLDAWGRKQSTGTVLNRALNNFLNPSYVSDINTTNVEAELQRLYDAGYEGMFPSAVQRSSELDDKRITADQWTAWQTEKGQSAYKALKNFIGTEEYNSLTDDQKAKYVEKVYDYAAASGKVAAGGDPEDEYKWIQAADKAGDVGMPKEKFVSLYAYKSSLDDELGDDEVGASIKQGVWEQYVNGRSDLNDAQKKYVKENIMFWTSQPASASSYEKALNAGYSDPGEIQRLLNSRREFDLDGNNSYSGPEIYDWITSTTDDVAEQQKMYNGFKNKGTTKSFSEFMSENAKKSKAIKAAKNSLDGAVGAEKQTAFESAVSGLTAQKDVKAALKGVDATEDERIAYFNYVKAKRGWKKSWYQIKG